MGVQPGRPQKASLILLWKGSLDSDAPKDFTFSLLEVFRCPEGEDIVGIRVLCFLVE